MVARRITARASAARAERASAGSASYAAPAHGQSSPRLMPLPRAHADNNALTAQRDALHAIPQRVPDGDAPHNGWRFTCAAQRSGAASGGSAG